MNNNIKLKLKYNGFEKTIKEKNITITLEDNILSKIEIENETLKKILYYILIEDEKALKKLETKIKGFTEENKFIHLEIKFNKGSIIKKYDKKNGLNIEIKSLENFNYILKNSIILSYPFNYKFLSKNKLKDLEIKLLNKENHQLNILNNEIEKLKTNKIFKRLENLNNLKIIIRKTSTQINEDKFNFKNFEDLKNKIQAKIPELLSIEELKEIENKLSFYFKYKFNKNNLNKDLNNIYNSLKEDENIEDNIEKVINNNKKELENINKFLNMKSLKDLLLLLTMYPFEDIYDLYLYSEKNINLLTKEKLVEYINNLEKNIIINHKNIEIEFKNLYEQYHKNYLNIVNTEKLLEEYNIENKNYLKIKEEFLKALNLLNLSNELEFNITNIKLLQTTLKEEKNSLIKEKKEIEEHIKELEKEIKNIQQNILKIENIFINIDNISLPEKYIIENEKCYTKIKIDEKEYEIPVEENEEEEINEFIENLNLYNKKILKELNKLDYFRTLFIL